MTQTNPDSSQRTQAPSQQAPPPPQVSALLNQNLSNEDRIEMRRRLVEQMHIQGETARGIARLLTRAGYEVSNRTISTDINLIHEKWRDAANVDVEGARAAELAKITELEHRCWNGMVNSLAGRNHNAAVGYMNSMIRALERRSKLLGLDVPTRQAGDTPENPLWLGHLSEASRLDAMTEEQLDKELNDAVIEAGRIIAEGTR